MAIPELPFDAVPVDSSIFPVSPSSPEFAVTSETSPLEVVSPTPDVNDSDPPVPAVAFPPLIRIPPPRS